MLTKINCRVCKEEKIDVRLLGQSKDYTLCDECMDKLGNYWIKVTDKHPPEGKYVILLCRPIASVKEDLMFIGNCIEKKRIYSIWGDGWVPFEYVDILYWMPLPEKPNQ